MRHSLRALLAAGWIALTPAAALSETIEVMGGSYIKDLMTKAAGGFSAENPGTDVTVTVGPRSDDELAQTMLRRATVGDVLPDVVITGSGIRLFAERGIAAPLDPLLAAEPQSPLLAATPVVLDKGKVRNARYGAAVGISIPVVLFNAELVRKAGGDPDHLPTDWDGILGLASKINGLGAPVVGGFMEADNTGALSLLSLLQSQGGRLMDEAETRLMLATPEGLKALTILEGFGKAGQASAAMTRDQARQAFGAGAIGVFVTMSSTIARHEAAAAGRFKVLSVPLPVVPGGGTIPTAGPIALIFAKDPAKQQSAFKFLEFLASPKGQLVVVTASGYLPANQKAIDASQELRAALARQPNAASVISRLPVTTGWYEPPGMNAAKIATIVNRYLFDVATLKTAPADALKALAAEVSALLPTQ